MQKTLKNLDVNVGSVIAGSEMEIKKASKKEYDKEYRLNNKEKIKEYNLNNKEKKKEYVKEYYSKNKEKIKKYGREYSKEYRLNNKEKLNKQKTIYRKKRRYTNIEYRLTLNLRRRVLLALQGKSKSSSTLKLLGCTPKFFKIHIEKQFKPGMSWDKRHLFHIDHIRPCASFDLSKPEEQEKCFHYTNLQPLWAKDNLSKGAKYDG
jgi:hypothetical protein